MQILLCLLITIAPAGCVLLGAGLYALMLARRRYKYARVEFERMREFIS